MKLTQRPAIGSDLAADPFRGGDSDGLLLCGWHSQLRALAIAARSRPRSLQLPPCPGQTRAHYRRSTWRVRWVATAWLGS